MSSTYKSTPLFGGALVCDLPEKFADVGYELTHYIQPFAWSNSAVQPIIWLTHFSLNTCSKIRQVPDNQEVFIDKDGFTSIIFDIAERVGPKGSSLEIDGRALTTHLEELVGDDDDTVKVWNTTETQFSHLEYETPPFPPRWQPVITAWLDAC
jgi:hypothetical protein